MIWGMTLEPGKLYTEIMGEEVQLSLAAIDSRKEIADGPNSFCQIIMKTSKSEYVLCTLVHGVMFQQSLDLKLMPREKVTFSVQGPNVVYLMGYTASYPEEMEMEEEFVESTDNSSSWEQYGEQEEPYMVLKRPDEYLKSKAVEPGGQIDDGSQLEDVAVNAQPVPVVKTEHLDMADLPQTGLSQGGAIKVEVLPQGQEDFYNNQTGSNLRTTTDGNYPIEEFYYSEEAVPMGTQEVYQSTSVTDIQDAPSEEILPVAQAFTQDHETAPSMVTSFNPSLQVGTSTSTIMAPLRSQPSPRRQARGGRGRAGRKPKNTGHLRTLPGPGQGRLAGGLSTSSGYYVSVTSESQSMQLNQSSSDGPAVAANSSTLKCSFCSKRYVSAEKLRNHERGHQNRKGRVGYLCRFCSRGFSNTGAVILHERIHTGEKPFTCKYCSKSFTQKGNQQRHERTCISPQRANVEAIPSPADLQEKN